MEFAVEARHVGRVLDAEEVQPFLSGPGAGTGGPAGFDFSEGVGMRVGGAGGNAGLVKSIRRAAPDWEARGGCIQENRP